MKYLVFKGIFEEKTGKFLSDCKRQIDDKQHLDSSTGRYARTWPQHIHVFVEHNEEAKCFEA